MEAPMELHFMFVLLRGAVGRILSLSPPAAPRPPPDSLLQAWGIGAALHSLSFAGAAAGVGFPQLRVPRSGQMSYHAWEVQGCARGLHLAGQTLQISLPISACPQSLTVVPPLSVWHLKPPPARVSGRVTAEETAEKQGGCSSLAPRPAVLPDKLGYTVSPTTARPSPLGTANSRWNAFCSESLQDAAPYQGLVRGEPFCPPLPGHPHPGWHREHLSRGGTTLPSASSCRSRAEVRHFVLISLSKPMKQKFPHGKPLIFECARMCWKPSQWKIPNQPHSTLAHPVKPLTREHLSAAVVPALLSGWKSCGMHRAGAAPPASPQNWGGRVQCSQGLVSHCASFAPLFLLKCICPSGFTPQCRAMQAAPEPGCSALRSAPTQQSVAAQMPSGALLVLPHHSWPANSPPHPHSHLCPARAPQPHHRHPAATPSPAHPLPPPQSPRALKNQERSGKSRSHIPPCYQLPGGCPSPCLQCQLGLSAPQGPTPQPNPLLSTSPSLSP